MNLPQSGECDPQRECRFPYKVMLAKNSAENIFIVVGHSYSPLAGSWAPAIIMKLKI